MVSLAPTQGVRAVTSVTASAVVTTSLTPVQTPTRSLVTQVSQGKGRVGFLCGLSRSSGPSGLRLARVCGAAVSPDDLFSHRGPASGENHHARALPAPAAAAAAAAGLAGAGPADPGPGPGAGADQGGGQVDTGERPLENRTHTLCDDALVCHVIQSVFCTVCHRLYVGSVFVLSLEITLHTGPLP